MTTPMLYFTRTPFTEPTNIVLTFAGLAVAWDALRHPRTSRFALAGGLLGAPALARIDGGAVAAGLLLGLGLVAAGSRDPARRRALVRGFVAATLSALSMVGAGVPRRPGELDGLPRGAPVAVRAVARDAAGLPGGCGDRAGGGAAASGVARRASRRAGPGRRRRGHRSGRCCWPAGRCGGRRTMSNRARDRRRSWPRCSPWRGWPWTVRAAMTSRRSPGWPGTSDLVTVVLAAVGAAWMLHESIARRRASLFVLLATLGVPALLYLVRPEHHSRSDLGDAPVPPRRDAAGAAVRELAADARDRRGATVGASARARRMGGPGARSRPWRWPAC